MAADIYTSLEGAPGAIRILILLPGSSDEELECQLEETSLGADPSYVALSHVWDNYIDSGLDGRVKAANFAKVFVRCNGRLVPISANLYSALRRLRDKLNPVRLWVDMLCIDQDDIEERNHQVTLMRQIYERSQEVIIWLGDIFPDSFDHQEFFAFALISRLAAGAHIISQGVFHSLVFTHDDGKISTGISELTQMMSMAWWERIWVIQESVVSTKATVYYGNQALPWTVLARAASTFYSEMASHPMEGFGGGVRDMSQMRDPLAKFTRTVLQIETTRAEWMSGQGVSLLPLLRKFRSSDSSDDRDKVFAVLGLVKSWEHTTPMLPNYALSVEAVFWRTAVKVISMTQSLSLLEGTLQDRAQSIRQRQIRQRHGGVWMAPASPEATLELPDKTPLTQLDLEPKVSDRTPPLPSWVVDWSIPTESAENERLSHLRLFAASAGRTGLVQLHGTSILQVLGFVVDTICSVGEDMPSSSFTRMRVTVGRWLNVACPKTQQKSTQIQLNSGNIAKGSQLEAFASVICGGLVFKDISSTQPDTSTASKGTFLRATTEDFRAFQDWSKPDRYSNRRTTIVDNTFQGWTDADANRGANSLHFAIEASSGGRKFFVCQNGYMGVGPPTLVEGDIVCVVLGCRVPLILRPRPQAVAACRGHRLKVLVRSPLGSSAVKQCSDTHRRLFELVGDAYVHGIMDGEMVQRAELQYIPPEPLYLV